MQEQLQKAQDQGRSVPALDAKPVLDEHLVLVFHCWTFLHSRRQVGFSANPISLSDMLAVIDMHGVIGDQRDDWIELLVALDQEFLMDQRQKAAAARAAAKAKAKKSGK